MKQKQKMLEKPSRSNSIMRNNPCIQIDGDTGHSSITQVVQQYSPAHNDAVTSLASLTSEHCVSGGKDKTVVIYNWKTGGVQQKFIGHERDVTKVTCLFQSNRIFSASRDKTALMWDMYNKVGPLQEFTGHELVVTGLAVSPDGLQLCTGSRDNSMCIWDVETGNCLQSCSISRNLVTHICWVPAESLVIQTSEDKMIRIWDSRELQLWDLRQAKRKVCEYKGHLQTTAACIFLSSATSTLPLVATSAHDCTVKIWNRDTAVCVSSLCLDGAGPLTSLASSDAVNLLCGSFNTGIHHLQVNHSNSCSLSEVARF
ncbi:WD repeat-containing protein 31 isoform X3 [Carcharodon carcharias]|uniref:WD repeat-containing protein 31 isoform X3 n=1 Tax=Carcharodon carcharias TaxID=13397 RepID=UPI001B7E1C77|nr:WD repeat-containing protein 31 isoform X3 [Carcharodon carcharias]